MYTPLSYYYISEEQNKFENMCESGNFDIVKKLIPNDKNNDYYALFMNKILTYKSMNILLKKAANCGNLEMVKIALEYGADDFGECICSMYAEEYEKSTMDYKYYTNNIKLDLRTQIVNELIKYGMDITEIFNDICFFEDIHLVKYLVDSYSHVLLSVQYGLEFFCRRGNYEIVLLLYKMVQIKSKNKLSKLIRITCDNIENHHTIDKLNIINLFVLNGASWMPTKYRKMYSKHKRLQLFLHTKLNDNLIKLVSNKLC